MREHSWEKMWENTFSYAEYRPNTNAAMLWITGHDKERLLKGRVEKLRTWIGSYPTQGWI
jgi:hypothetical protein